MKKLLLIIQLVSVCILANAQTSGDWTELGPKDFPPHLNWQISGVARISQMKFHPTDPNTLYAVNSMGGIFISRDKGANWTGTGADNLPQTRCSSICIDYVDDQVLYLGTGDPSYYSQGLGIWKSTDGGNTFNQSTAGVGNRLAVEILMSPTNRNILLAATNDGIWKSTNAGASWAVKKTGGDFTDMVLKAAPNSQTVYAATRNEFWRSDDMGENWTRTNLPGTGIQNGGRIAVSKADANLVYLTFVGNKGANVSTPVLKSTDNGNSFTVVRAASAVNMNGYDQNSDGQGNYNYGFSVNPNNANHLMIVGHVIWRSLNGGVTWTQLSLDWAHQVHTDMRGIGFSPYTANEIYNVNDGGIWRSWDNGDSWLPICNGLVGTESYIGCQSPLIKNQISIGAQDNGEYVYTGGQWYINGGGDYHSNIIHDNLSANYYYDLSGTGRKRGLPYGGDNALNLPFDAGNGQSVFADFPVSNNQLAYLGYKEVYRSTNISNNPPVWTQISAINRQVKAVASSPSDANVVYVITDDAKIRRSDNALAATPGWTTYNTPSATNVTASIVVINSNTDIVYIVCNNKIYRSANKGANWTDVSGNAPNVNYHKILHDKFSTNEAVYVAGYSAVLYKDNSLTNWANYSKGLPSVVNFHKIYLYNDGTDNSELTLISAGRGVWHTGLYGKNAVLRSPENPENAIPGIVYQAYEGTWNHIPNYNSLTPAKTGAAVVPNISVRTREDNFGLQFDGYIDVPADGKYTFYTNSDDGSIFYIGTETVVSNDGAHGATEQSGYMWLKKGKHIFTIKYVNGTGDKSLSFSWQGPGIAKQLVPANVLYRLSPMNTCPENGSISVQKWTGVGGNTVGNIPVATTPNLTFANPNFESKTDDGDNYGVRYRGYICPPYTGNYTFYLASDDNSELWLSTTGNVANRVRIASLNGSVNQRNWYGNPSQKSARIFLKAGQKYYVEGLHKEGAGGDHFAVAWILPSGEFQAPISGRHLSPFKSNTFPTVSISSPLDNFASIQGTNINVTANAADADGTVSKVEFYLDDIKVGEDLAAPFAYTWTAPQAGVYALTARATDNLNAVTASANIKVTIVSLRVPENPALTKTNLEYKYYEYTGEWSALPDYNTLVPLKTGFSPNFNIDNRNRDNHYGFQYKGFIDIPADGIYTFYVASDDGGKLYFGNQLLISNDGIHGDDYEITNVIGLQKGKHAVSLDFFQNTGGQGLAISYSGPGTNKTIIPAGVLYRQINSNNAPSVIVSSNASNGTAPATFTLTANAKDNDGTIARVEFYSNGVLLTPVSTTSPYVYNFANQAVGTYEITAKAYDDNNAVTTSNAISIVVKANQIPVVSITSPLHLTTFTEPANVTIQANATDADGTVKIVEFYNGTFKLGEDPMAPYSFTWTNVAAGTYNITAKAYDNLNAMQTSAVITITIDKITTDIIDVIETSSADVKVFPNPVYTSVNIDFDVKSTSQVVIHLYDIQGNLLKTLEDKPYAAGPYHLNYDVRDLSDAAYVLKIEKDGLKFVHKILKGSTPGKSGMK